MKMKMTPVALQAIPGDVSGNASTKASNGTKGQDVPFQQFLSNEMSNRASSSKGKLPAAERDKAKMPSKNETAPAARHADSHVAKGETPDSSGKEVAGTDEDQAEKVAETAGNPVAIEQLLAMAGQQVRPEAVDEASMTESEESGSRTLSIGTLALKPDESGDEDKAEAASDKADKLAYANFRERANRAQSGDNAGGKEKVTPAELKETGKKSNAASEAGNKADAKAKEIADDNRQGFREAVQRASDAAAPKASAAENQVNPVVQANTGVAPVQVAAPQMIKEQFDPASNRIMQQVGTTGWEQAIGQKAIWMAGKEQQSASLTLNPPELGPLQVVLKVSNSQASASFTSAYPEVRHALEASMPRLREMLGQAGIQLGDAHVGAETQNNQFAASQSDRRSSSHGGSGAEADSGHEMVSNIIRQPVRRGLVDTFA